MPGKDKRKKEEEVELSEATEKRIESAAGTCSAYF